MRSYHDQCFITVSKGFRFDVTQKGNANGGHSYATELSEPEKRAHIETWLGEFIAKRSLRAEISPSICWNKQADRTDEEDGARH
jgi:hypothetical protein